MNTRDNFANSFENGVRMAFKGIFMIVIMLLFVLLIGFVVMWLWNWLLPDLFGLRAINYWEAVGILALSKILFGFGGNSSKGGHKKKQRYQKLKDFCYSRKNFSDWKYYDSYWKEDGQQAYEAYVQRQQNNGNEEGDTSSN